MRAPRRRNRSVYNIVHNLILVVTLISELPVDLQLNRSLRQAVVRSAPSCSGTTIRPVAPRACEQRHAVVPFASGPGIALEAAQKVLQTATKCIHYGKCVKCIQLEYGSIRTEFNARRGGSPRDRSLEAGRRGQWRGFRRDAAHCRFDHRCDRRAPADAGHEARRTEDRRCF